MSQKNKTSTRIIMEHTEEDVDLPPPHLHSSFRTVQDWLFSILEKDRPQKHIDEFKFGLFELIDGNVIFLVGVNTSYDKNQPSSTTLIEFKPTDMYFKLPKTYVEGLTHEQFLNNLYSELKDFTNTEKFKTSFFTKANIVVFETNGQTIWSK